MSRHAAPTARLRRVAVTAALVAGAVTLPTGVAQAYWRTTGTGSAAASAGNLSPLTGVAATADVAGPLAPGSTGTLVVAVRNPNSMPITVTAVTAGAGPIGVSGALGTCTNPAVTVVPRTGLSTVVAPGASVSIPLPGAVTMGQADNGCQGANFSVPVTVTGRIS
ncbi:hypothetical protein GCM10009547_47620 [Sporichthya brevicatena]|uniref:Uncharacterized protein n=1 Tax=Sporichthya brevicatena TaxID=171442 RepID=A0ABN1HC79_9ACTN